MKLVWRITVGVAAFTLSACNETVREEAAVLGGSSGGVDSTPIDDDPEDETGGPFGPLLDIGADPDGPSPSGGCPSGAAGGDATLSGTVFAPNGELPISGAVVWAQPNAPDGIPDHVYCESCVELPCAQPHTLTRPDGSFDLSLPSGTSWFVVQKGQFMRATEVEVAPESAQTMSTSATTLPSTRAPADGKWTPKIALAWGEYDQLEDGLAKLGLGELEGGRTLVPGSERFDVWTNHSGDQHPLTTDAKGTFAELLSDPELLAQYHIIFVPCTSSPHTDLLDDPEIVENVRQWVEAGGKWYVSDWSLAFLEKPFPSYQDWWEDDWSGGPYLDDFDTRGTVLDDDLRAWLDGLPPELGDINPQNPDNPVHPTLEHLPEIELVDLWSTIKKTPPVLVDDGNGNEVDVGHRVWIEGPGGGGDGAPRNKDWPLAVTAEYGCGRMLFSSYHTVEWSEGYQGLTPQELVLMYLILEIGVCQVPYEPPPVP